MNWAARMKDVLSFRDEREWEQFHHPKELVSGLSIEVGELAEHFLWKTREETDEALKDSSFRRRVSNELADVQVFVMYLVERLGVDIDEAILIKLRENAEKYPVEKSRGRADKYTDL